MSDKDYGIRASQMAPSQMEAVRRMEADLAALRAQLTAAEAAREAVAGEVREMCAARVESFRGTVPLGDFKEEPCNCPTCYRCVQLAAEVRKVELPTPPAALQRVREQALREGAERLRERLHRLTSQNCQGRCVTLPSEVNREFAALFPTPDAEAAP